MKDRNICRRNQYRARSSMLPFLSMNRKQYRRLTVEALEDRRLLVVGANANPAGVATGAGFDGVVAYDIGNTAFSFAGCTGSLLTTGRHILTAAHCVNNNEEQIIDLGASTGGSYQLQFGGQTTAAIAFNATAAAVDAALESLATIGAGDVRVFDGPDLLSIDYIVRFVGAMNTTNVALLTVVNDTLVGGSASVSTDTQGGLVSDVAIRFELPDGDIDIATSDIVTHGAWNGDTGFGNDVALITLPVLAPAGAERYDIFRGNNEVGQNFTLVGYGRTGTGTTGGQAGTGGVKRMGQNTWDALSNVLANAPVSETNNPPAGSALTYDFDNGTAVNDFFGTHYATAATGLGAIEAMQAQGDSGGPAFIGSLISGIVSFSRQRLGQPPDVDGIGNNTFGEYAVMARASFYDAFIDSNSILESGPLVIDMTRQPAGRDALNDPDTIRIHRDGANLVVSIDSVEVQRLAFSSITAITVNGSNDDDTLIVDYSGGNPIPTGNLSFDASGGTNTLRIQNGAWNSNTYEYTNATDGSVTLDGSVITYEDLAPIINTGIAANIVFDLPAGPNSDVVLRDDGFGADPDGNTVGASAIDGSTFEFTQFTNPTNSLTINGGNSGDTLEVIAMDAAFNANVIVNGGTADDEFTVNATTGTTNLWTINGGNGNDTLTIEYAAFVTFANATDGTVTSFTGLPQLDFTSIEAVRVIGDYGDAPASYGTLFGPGSPAAHHAAGSTLQLGASLDEEVNGLPSVDALGDDGDNLDDEDGVIISSTLVPRLGARITLTASAAGFVDAWIDYNRNGVFDAAEQIATSFAVSAGDNELIVPEVPANAVAGDTYARFRLSTAGGLAPTGSAADGEVEDYALEIFVPPPGSVSQIEDPENPGTTLLLVNGTAATDAIVVQPVPGNFSQHRVVIAPPIFGPLVFGPIAPASYDRLVVFGNAGHDSIVIDYFITKPTALYGDDGIDSIVGGSGPDRIYGGAGNDSLVGGLGPDVLLGGAGNDHLHGGLGNDLLIGGTGMDWLYGQEGDDIDIGGTTAHDGNFAALEAIMAEWSSASGFNTRVSNLGGLLNAGTVLGDGTLDFLFGNAGRDWFLDFQSQDILLDYLAFLGDRRN
jgi:hypothetical protein